MGDPDPTRLSGVPQPTNPFPPEVLHANIRSCMERKLPTLTGCAAHDGVMAVVGGGPSLQDHLKQLRRTGATVVALNGVHDYLLSKGIKPEVAVIFDPREDCARYVQNWRQGITYMVASQCNPAVFDALEGADVVKWHANVLTNEQSVLGDYDEPWVILGGGSTVFTRTLMIGYVLGYRKFDLYGIDSCYRAKDHHAYKQPLRASMMEGIGTLTIDGEEFRCAQWMAAQYRDFMSMKERLDISFRAFCDGPIAKVINKEAA